MSFSTNIDNKKKDILVLGKRPTQGLDHTLTLEKCIWLITLLTKKEILFELTLQWSKKSFFSSMVQKFTNLKQKDSEIVGGPLYLGNISNDW